MQTSNIGLNVIRSFEGRALRAYQDSVGVWTIGYGSTNMDKNAVAEFGQIKKGLLITPEQAERVFVQSIRTGYEPAVNKALPKATQPQFDAGSSFHFNTGAIAKASWPHALERGDMALCKTSILSWNHAGGTVLAGLTRRRSREWEMINSGDYGPEGKEGPLDLETHKQLPAVEGDYVVTPILSHPTPESTGSRVPGLLRLGDVGDRVAEINGYLVSLGRLPAPATDRYDITTETAVKKYQGEHPNLTTDGIVGPATTASLQRDIKLNGSTKKTVQATTFLASAGAVAATLGWATLKIALITAGVAGAAGLIFIVLNHRTELETLWNRLRGKQVP
jgi:lysozyme